MEGRHLIVVSLPGGENADYYKKSLPDIVDFIKELDIKTAQTDDLLILHDNKRNHLEGVEFIHAKCLTLRRSLDLWMRDFTPTVPSLQVPFTYKPTYLKFKDSAWISERFDSLLNVVTKKMSFDVEKCSIILDGGNVVDNDMDKAIVTERIISDNKHLTAAAVLKKVEQILRKRICVIPDPGDSTGHADGIVSFIERNTLLLADYGNKDEYKTK